MGVLIGVVKAPDQEHRYLVCPGKIEAAEDVEKEWDNGLARLSRKS
jgi:hypothetical protein